MPSTSRERGARDRLRDRFFATGTVTQIDPIARRMLRIRIDGDGIPGLAFLPGQHVHVADTLEPRSWLRPRDMLRS
jgi:NAD(P)H-flavin reductase